MRALDHEHMSHVVSTYVVLVVSNMSQFMPLKSDTNKTVITHNELPAHIPMYAEECIVVF